MDSDSFAVLNILCLIRLIHPKIVSMMCHCTSFRDEAQRIKTLHKYELPAVIVLPIIGGLKDYLDYISNETS